MSERKIRTIPELAEIVRQEKAGGKTVALFHGCFDLMHPGHVKYFQSAKAMADILIVTLTRDVFVDKGPGRPVFGERLRAETIAALECVDWVGINDWKTAEETLRLLVPTYYVKGQEFENLQDKTGKIQKEAALAKELGVELRFTHEIVFSSTDLLNRFFLRKDP
jgi:rfaE bifunctional protein nucleotidyltransferase chain/domain